MAIAFGLVCLLLPGAAILSLLIVFAAYAMADAVFAIIAAVRAARGRERWLMLVLEAVTGIVAAAAVLVWPGLSLVAFMLVIAAWALISGGLGLAAAFALKQDHGQVWMALGAVASIILGFILVLAPALGAVALTWWLGAYAFVFGISLLVLALRLRRRHEIHPQGAVSASP
jgi:uncharacterized membrane protein HdeD (DUF308 family)